ncbi:MAG: hypothetical protein V2A54_01105 [Bacteroidota bacterium]
MLHKFMAIFGLFMVGIYIFLGAVLLFTDYYAYFPEESRFAIGIFFMAYGLFRLVRVYFKYKQQKKEEML